MTPTVSKTELEQDWRLFPPWHMEYLRKGQGLAISPQTCPKPQLSPLCSTHSVSNVKILLRLGIKFNDVEILQYCQTGIAMGKAPDELKAVADYVTVMLDRRWHLQRLSNILA